MLSRYGLTFSLSAVAVLLVACGKPAPRDPSGRVLFQPELIRHPAETPYWCFTAVVEGSDLSNCEVIKDWCVRNLEQSKASGSSITSGCKETDQVWCFTTGRGHASACQKSAEDCAKANKRMAERILGQPEEVSECKPLDRHFQPAK